jgi:hypothetical protein
MFSTLALAAIMSLTPAQPATAGPKLTLTNPKATFGELGTARPDSKLLPGDIYFLSFDIEGITVDKEGKVVYTMEMVVSDKTGKPILKQQPLEKNDFLPLGGTTLPARAYVSIGPDQAAGIYVCKLTVTDRATKQTSSVEKTFEVSAPDFGLVQVYSSCDDRGAIPAPQVGIVGQSIWVHFAVVGFERTKAARQPDLSVEMTVYDKSGKPTLQMPTIYDVNKDIPEADKGIPLRFMLPMNRAGDFTVELKTTDKISKKISKVTLPFKVLPVGN